MSMLHFRGVALNTTEAALRAKFEEYGEVKDFEVSDSKQTLRRQPVSRFGYVEFTRERDAEAALHDMNNERFDGQNIQVERFGYIPIVSPQPPSPPRQAKPKDSDSYWDLDTGKESYLAEDWGYITTGRPLSITPSIGQLDILFGTHLGTRTESHKRISPKSSDMNEENTLPGPSYSSQTQYSGGDSTAAKTNQSQKLEITNFRWELPSLLKLWAPSADHLARTEFVLEAITLVVRGKYIELSSCEQYLDKFYPRKGVKLVETIMSALSSSSLVAVEQDIVVTTLDDQLIIGTTRDLQAQIRDIAVWLCLAFRMPRNGSTPMISTGTFDGTTFTLSAAPMFAVRTCWYPLFDNAVVVVKPFEPFPSEGGLLKLSFGALLQLAAVEYPVMVDSGLVLMGYSTALVPIEINNDGQILWHLEVASGNQQLRKSELQATKGSWLQKQSLEELQTTEALLGWCSSANIQLGTDCLKTADVTWSTVPIKHTTWHWKGANLQLLAQSAAPAQIGGQLGFSWERSFNTI